MVTPAAYAPYAGINGYDQRANTYNLKPKHLLRTRSALAHAAAGTGLCNIAFCGDSTTAGYPAVPGLSTYPDWVQRMLATQGYPSAGNLCSAYKNTGIDSRVTFAGAWAAFADSTIMDNSTDTAALTFAFTTASTYVRVFHADIAGSSFTVTIDGGAPATVTAAGTNNPASWTSGVLASANHTVVINRVGGGVYIAGVETLTSLTTGVRIFDSGVGQSAIAFWDSIGTNGPSQFVTTSTGFPADLIVLMTIVNDDLTPTATYLASLLSVITKLKASGSDIILGTCWPTTGSTNLLDRIAAVYQAADTNDLPVMDFYDRQTGVWRTDLMTDPVHPNVAGYNAYARQLVAALLS